MKHIHDIVWVYDLETGEKLFPALAGGADDVVLNAGSGGDTIAADQIPAGSGPKFQRVKLVEGADGVNDGDISSANPLPVDVSDSATRDLGKVDIAAFDVALPAGTNAIGKLAANTGVDIGDVDVTSIVPGSGATNLGKAEDAAHTTGDIGVMALAVRRAADTPTSGLDGDYEPLKTDANGHLKVEIFDGGDSHTIDGTVTANAGTGTFTVDGSGVTQPVSHSSLAVVGGGTEATAMRVTLANDSTGVITVDGTITANAGTGTMTVDLGANNDVQGQVAHDAAVSGNPVTVGGEARTTNPTAVGDGDSVRIMCDDQGRVITSPHAPRDLVNIQQTNLANTSETTIVTAAVSTFHDLVGLTVHNGGAALNQVTIRDSTAGTTRFVLQLAADGGGTVLAPCVPIPQATVNNNWTAQASVTGDVDITAIYIKRT